MIECPNHQGHFDCTPFCSLCEGNQGFIKPDALPCNFCQTPIEFWLWLEELGMCVDCSHKYYNHQLDPVTGEEI